MKEPEAKLKLARLLASAVSTWKIPESMDEECAATQLAGRVLSMLTELIGSPAAFAELASERSQKLVSRVENLEFQLEYHERAWKKVFACVQEDDPVAFRTGISHPEVVDKVVARLGELKSYKVDKTMSDEAMASILFEVWAKALDDKSTIGARWILVLAKARSLLCPVPAPSRSAEMEQGDLSEVAVLSDEAIGRKILDHAGGAMPISSTAAVMAARWARRLLAPICDTALEDAAIAMADAILLDRAPTKKDLAKRVTESLRAKRFGSERPAESCGRPAIAGGCPVCGQVGRQQAGSSDTPSLVDPAYPRDRPSPDHSLKCHPRFFEQVLRGEKPFDIRLNDRDFKVGHRVELLEWDPVTAHYTGRGIRGTITCVVGNLELKGISPVGMDVLNGNISPVGMDVLNGNYVVLGMRWGS